MKRVLGFAVLAGLVAAPLALPLLPHARAAEGVVVPMPRLDEAGHAGPEVAVLAGGCFWGVQGVFQHVRGVSQAVAGYTGGKADTAQYETVSSGETGHAESVRITYDPRQISYGRLLNIYFSVAHDPTLLDAQGPDEGTQYRSAIFPQDAEQARIAQAYVAQLNAGHVFASKVVTSMETGRQFYPAEQYHQNFLARNPDYPYIAVNDLPKVAALKAEFPSWYQTTPVLVPGS